MDLHFKRFISSLKNLRFDFVYTFAVDILFWAVFAGGITIAGDYIKRRSIQFSGMDQAALQNMIATNPQQAEAFLSGLKGFLLSYILIVAAIVIGGLLLYSLSRGIIWNYLLDRKLKAKGYWRWNLLNIVLLIGVIIWVILLLIAKGLLSLVSSNSYYTFIISLIVISLFFTGWLFLQFNVYKKFTLRYRIFSAIGETLEDMKKSMRTYLYKYAYANALFILLFVVLIPFRNIGAVTANISIIEGVIVLIYMAWLRIYLQ